jgi:Flp pilus assembly protein TadG
MFSKIKNKIYTRIKLKSEKGVVAVIVALLLVALVGIMAYVIDEGSIYQTRGNLQTVADAAALAGAQELPDNTSLAIQKAINYAASNGVTISSSNVTISTTYVSHDTITVSVSNPNKKLYFAGVFGMNSINVGAKATALVCSPTDFTGTVPFGIVRSAWSPGNQYSLNSSNFAALELGGTGSTVYQNNITNGYSGTLEVGDSVKRISVNFSITKQGTTNKIYNKPDNHLNSLNDLTVQTTVGDGSYFADAGLTDFGYLISCHYVYNLEKNDSQFVICPLISSLPYVGYTTHIVDFVPFIITSVDSSTITGTFINEALIDNNGPVGGTDSNGIKVIRLIR